MIPETDVMAQIIGHDDHVPPAATSRPRSRFGRIVPNIVLLVSAMFFALPLLSIARFALQNVPTVLWGWDTLFDKWSLNGLTQVFSEDEFWVSLELSVKLASARQAARAAASAA